MNDNKQEAIFIKLNWNASGRPYAAFTDKIIAMQKGDLVIILDKKDLQNLEKCIGAKFKL